MSLKLQRIAIVALIATNSIVNVNSLNPTKSEDVEVDGGSTVDLIGDDGDTQLYIEDDLTMMDDFGPAEDMGMWPFNKSNKTHEDTRCSTHKDCHECSSSSSFCHWCSHDNRCHAKGSMHGCFEGVTCDPPKPKENSTCGSHATCSDCALASSLCHWCAHDNACHAVGSMYGCVTGVDCYSNDRCQRFEPEEIAGMFLEDVGIIPMVIIFSVALFCCCCATLGFCTASGFKGAYDDIVVVAAGNSEGSFYNGGPRTVTFSREPTEINVPAPIQERENEDTTEDDHETQNQDDEETPAEELEAGNDLGEEAALLAHHMDQYQDTHDGYSLMTGMVSAAPSAYATVQARGGTNAMQGIFNVCRVCYFITLIGIVGFVGVSMRCFPRVPTYNVCNDNLAWKQVVEKMKSLKPEATIEILVSVLNPNHFGVAVDMGRGNFKHKGVFVGTFDIPPTTVVAMSVTDVRIVAHFTPGTWEALSLTNEYRKGTLTFDIDAKATFRFPGMLGYSMTSSFNDIHVLVNDPLMDDRHLCKCPTWDDEKNKTIAVF